MDTVSEEIRCPSCWRLLVLRSGPVVTPHFAHRPRQACRNRPGRGPITTLRLEQLTLFDVAIVAPPERPVPLDPFEPAVVHRPEAHRRRRRRAWLPRLLRWLKTNF